MFPRSKVAVVTGGAQGIGQAIALQMATKVLTLLSWT